jgi:hypothetical protein
MGTYVAATYPQGYELFSTLFWGVSIFVVLVVLCVFAWKAIEWIRDRRDVDVVALEHGQSKDPEAPWEERAISRPSADFSGFSGYYGDEMGGLGGMNQREQEDLFSIYAPRKVRKAMKARRRARKRRIRRH